MVPQGSGGGPVKRHPGGGDPPAKEAKDLLLASIRYQPDYLYVKFQEVHTTMEVMEEMEVTQEEMKKKLRWAQTIISYHPGVPSLMVIQIPVGIEVADPRGRKHVSICINKWAKPIPNLELPPRVHFQKACKIKQIWELWSMNVALAMATWKMMYRSGDCLASSVSPV